MNLNLDKDFRPFANNKEIEFEQFTFSGGEPHIKIITDLSGVSQVTITHRIRSFNDFGFLLLAINALKNLGINTIDVFLPYFPAARQDRVMSLGEPLSVKVYSDILNSQNLNSITIFDTHSDVTTALLNRCKVISNFSFIEQIIQELPKNTLLISPDGGALKKIYKLAEHLKTYQVIEGSKKRDIITRKLSGFMVYAEDLQQKDCLIVDDICDGGGTFIGLAKALKAKNAGKLYLAVSHGIFSKGTEELKKHFELIYTTNSFQTIEQDKQVKQISISKLLK